MRVVARGCRAGDSRPADVSVHVSGAAPTRFARMAVGATVPMPPVDFDGAKVVAATAVVGLVLAVWLLLAICAARYTSLIRSNAFDIDGDPCQLPHMRACSARARARDVPTCAGGVRSIRWRSVSFILLARKDGRPPFTERPRD